MAEFQEVMREWVRSRKAINEDELSCCPLKMFTDDHIANIEKEVMAWAAEHPEPQYPTWFEYLYAINNPDYFDLTEFYTWMRHTPIPADIAQKLGIKPKEGTA